MELHLISTCESKARSKFFTVFVCKAQFSGHVEKSPNEITLLYNRYDLQKTWYVQIQKKLLTYNQR